MLPKDYGFKLKRTGQVVKPMDTLHDMKVALNALAMMIPVLDMATGTWTNFKVWVSEAFKAFA